MSRKTRFSLYAALAACTAFTIASAEGSGANAQPGENQQISEARLTEEVVPVFVENEVVQPVPEETTEAPLEITAPSLGELVARMPDRETLSQEMECLAGAVYFESRGEPLAGQLAVAQVVITRAASNLFPESYCSVVYQRAQFSFVRGGSMPRIRRGSSAWKRAKAVARIAHEALWESEADDALYFHAKYVKPSWSRRKQARATIESHIFYR